jgi:hypothetical protein
MITIVLAIIGYAIFMKTPIKEMSIGEEGVKVTFAVKAVDQRPGPTVYQQSPDKSGSEESHYLIQVPGEEPLPLTRVDRIVIEPGEDDPQNRHLELVGRALETGKVSVKYEEPDTLGQFSLWLTTTEVKEGRALFSYTTRLVRRDGSTEIAWREAYRQGDTWYTQISPDLKKLLAGTGDFEGSTDNPVRLDKPRIRSLAEINRALEAERYRLVRGQLDPKALLNLCFLQGRVTDEYIHQVESQGKSLAQDVGLTLEAAETIAEFGYSLYQEKEYLGSKVFWEAMTLLNRRDSYGFNMLGASLEGLKQIHSALEAYEQALEIDPQNANASKNVQRVRALLGADR